MDQQLNVWCSKCVILLHIMLFIWISVKLNEMIANAPKEMKDMKITIFSNEHVFQTVRVKTETFWTAEADTMGFKVPIPAMNQKRDMFMQGIQWCGYCLHVAHDSIKERNKRYILLPSYKLCMRDNWLYLGLISQIVYLRALCDLGAPPYHRCPCIYWIPGYSHSIQAHSQHSGPHTHLQGHNPHPAVTYGLKERAKWIRYIIWM